MAVDLVGKISERAFQDKVVELGHLFGWRVAHFGAAGTNKGFRTPVRYDGKGFPDLTLVHQDWQRVLFREIKVPPNKPTPEQATWGLLLTLAGADYATWYPRHWPEIEQVLSNGRIRPATAGG